MLGKIENRRRRGQQRMERWLDNLCRDGWRASPTQGTWVWASSWRWWRTGKAGMLQSMGSKRIQHNWYTEQQESIHFHLYIPTVMFVLLWKKSCSQTPFTFTVSFNTYWAGLHLCWSMTKKHRLTVPLLPGVWWSLGVPPQGGQEDRLRLDPLMQVSTIWGHKCGARVLEQAN